MKRIQLTLIQIDNYGPWTVNPEPRREADLQVLQSFLFADVERRFSEKGGLVFYTRFDNMLAISNGLGLEDHRAILEEINSKYPVTVSMGIGASKTPSKAQLLATHALQRVGGSRSRSRKGALVGHPVRSKKENWVQIAHIDVNNTSTLTDRMPVYDVHFLIQQIHSLLMSTLSRYGALVFYMGGDNFMAPSNGIEKRKFTAAFRGIKRKLGAELKAGIGCGPTAEVAARLASRGLQKIRQGNFSQILLSTRLIN